nr:hypothetical transcript [Hymenolepis microstoma]
MSQNSGGHSTEQSSLYTSGGRNGYPLFFSHSDEKGYVNLTTTPTMEDATPFTSPTKVGYQPAGGLQTYPPTGHQFGSILEGGSGFGQVPSGVNAPSRFDMVGYSGLFQRSIHSSKTGEREGILKPLSQ